MNKAQQNISSLMLILFSLYALYAVFFLHSSIFFIIYLFWFDEVIRNISLYIQIKMHVEDLRLNREFSKYQAISNIKARFFFLAIYAVFIVIVFGFFFYLAQETSDALVQNIRIVMFRDIPFNICLMIAVVREIMQIRLVRLKRFSPIEPFNAMSGHLLTLHLSIVFGGLMWALTSGKFEKLNFDLGTFKSYAVVLPFFVIKFLIDFYQIRNAGKTTGNYSVT